MDGSNISITSVVWRCDAKSLRHENVLQLNRWALSFSRPRQLKVPKASIRSVMGKSDGSIEWTRRTEAEGEQAWSLRT